MHSTAKIKIPWHLTMKHRACLGEKVNAYNLAEIEISEGSTIAQEVFLCTGTHDFSDENLQLITKKITIKQNVFIGARAMIMPGVKIDKGAIIGAMAVVTSHVHTFDIVAGNPARKIGTNSLS